MVGVGWLVIMDDWLGRGGPGGAMLGFLGGALLLLPIALTYGRLISAPPSPMPAPRSPTRSACFHARRALPPVG